MNVSVFPIVGEGAYGPWWAKRSTNLILKNYGKIKGKRKNPSIFLRNPLKYTK
jgi:hypothetical protein